MALSYPMKVSLINVEANRASNTANSRASGTTSTPTATSLFGLYASSGVNQAAPHKWSEFNGKSFASVTSYSSSVIGVFTQACPFNGSNPGLSQTYYHDGSGTLPAQGDVCYSNSGGTTVLLAGYYNINSATGQGNRQYIKITSGGVVELGFPQYC